VSVSNTQEQDYSTALTFTVAYLRSVEPNVEGIARETTGGLVRTEWARSAEVRAALEGVSYRHHDKLLTRLLGRAKGIMEEERAAWYLHAERVMASAQWMSAPESVRQEFLLRTAQATDTSNMGGPRVLGAHRPSAVALKDVYGEGFTHKTMSNATDALAALGWLKVTKGQGYEPGRVARSTLYELPDEATYTSPSGAGRACVSGSWLAEMEPLFRKLRSAFAAAVKLIRVLKTMLPSRRSHMPSEMYLAEPDPGLSQADEAALTALLGDDLAGASPPLGAAA
jgi:hypothetical protein